MAKLISFTQEGLSKVKGEKEKLLFKRKEAVENLKVAREMGDLSENAAYKVARAKLSSVDSRLRHLDRLIRFGRAEQAPQDGIVGIGSRVRLVSTGKEYNYQIVGSYESDPSRGTISHLAPLGKALMGKRDGEVVQVYVPEGSREYQIITVKSE